MKQYIVDAFTSEPFSGNPAAVCVMEQWPSEEQVRNMNPDQNGLSRIEGRIQNATAKGKETDCVSRSFCPKLSIAEDPVCGAAHCQIAEDSSEEKYDDSPCSMGLRRIF